MSATTIDAAADQLRPVNDVIKARLGKRISPATLWRWRLKGVNGVKLECLRVGGHWVTSDALFIEFLRAQTRNALEACRVAPTAIPAERTPEKIRRLKAAGLL
jgi:hypothetical protein